MKEIILTNGLKCLVDDEDYNFLNRWKWSAVKHRNTFYAVRGEYYNNMQMHHKMHRVIMGVSNPDTLIDHIDGNGLNNQKSNIRTCDIPQNRHNLTGWGISKFPGVTKRGKKWIARIRPKSGHIHLGTFATEQEAADAYFKKAQELYGEFVRKHEHLKDN